MTAPIHKNQRVLIDGSLVRTVVDVERTPLGVEVQVDVAGINGSDRYLADRVDATYDQRFPLFGVQDWGGTLVFYTLEPMPSWEIDDEERARRDDGIHSYCCYTAGAPEPVVVPVPADSPIMPLEPDQFEEARQSGWRQLPTVTRARRLEEMGLL